MAISRGQKAALHGAVIVVVLASAGSIVRSALIGDRAAPCSERYHEAIQWSLTREDGQLLSATDLQARLSGTEWGLAERARIVQSGLGGGNPALEVDLGPSGPATTGEQGPGQRGRSGVGFQWLPSGFAAPAAACLTYDVQLARDFDPSSGGRLPGLVGGRHLDANEQPDNFLVQLAWDDDGKVDAVGRVPISANPQRLAREPTGVRLSAAQWHRIDQEVVLNEPGRSNGVVRVWVDGRLALERRDLMLRQGGEAGIRGVHAEIAYSRPPSRALKGGRIAITPFVVRW